MATKDELKQRFAKGKRPTEQDFADLIDAIGAKGAKGAKGVGVKSIELKVDESNNIVGGTVTLTDGSTSDIAVTIVKNKTFSPLLFVESEGFIFVFNKIRGANMEKTIIIDGKEVRLKATGALPKRYKAQFGRDFFADLFSLESAAGKKKAKGALAIDFDIIYDITWTLAKTADNSIPDPITWLDSFDTFPIVDVTYEIKDMLAATIATKKK